MYLAPTLATSHGAGGEEEATPAPLPMPRLLPLLLAFLLLLFSFLWLLLLLLLPLSPRRPSQKSGSRCLGCTMYAVLPVSTATGLGSLKCRPQ